MIFIIRSSAGALRGELSRGGAENLCAAQRRHLYRKQYNDGQAVLDLEQLDDINVYLSYRKSHGRLCRLCPDFIIKFIIKRLTIKELESYLSGLFKIKARAVITPYAEIGVDVDKPSDLELARKLLSKEN